MKKVLPAAVLAASLTGVGGAQAVHLNPEGLGQVLLYPFYTAEGDQDTYINLVNTTSDYKAVKVRILESMNSREVLDFNLYLSPWDHWSAVITRDANGDGATLTSGDNSCTVPQAVSDGQTIPFRTFEFDGSRPGSTADSESGVDRTREGYVEVIEMGTVTESDYQAAIKHDSDGVPGDCDLLTENWQSTGVWGGSPNAEDGLDEGSGGLYGYGVLIDVPAGAAGAYDAVAIDNWAEPGRIYHTRPGQITPSIGFADLFYDVFTDGGVVSGEAFNGWDAVSAVMMVGSIANDYVLEPSVAAGTDWVVTFPTKREYVNVEIPDLPDTPDPIPPFTSFWNPVTSTACEDFLLAYYDREEAVSRPDPLDFSPLPPGDPAFSFCHEANVLTFNESNVLKASDRTGTNINLDPGFDNGWARINFVAEDRELVTLDDVFLGLPTIGFAIQRYVNGDVGGEGETVRANYSGIVSHKGQVVVSSAP